MNASINDRGTQKIWIQAGLIALAGLAWYAAAELSLAFTSSDIRLAPVWFASGLALAAVYLIGPKALIGVFPAALIAHAVYFSQSGVGADSWAPWTSALGISSGECLAAWWGAAQLKRWFPDRDVLAHPKGMWRFTLVVMAASMICAVIGATAILLSGLAPAGRYFDILLSWWLADSAGAIVLIPALISLNRAAIPHATARHWVETLLGAILLGTSLAYLFSPDSSVQQTQLLTFLLMPLAVWSVFRLPGAAVCLFLLLIAVLASFATTAGVGPFASDDSMQSLSLVQVFVLVLALVVLSLKAGVNERRSAMSELKRARKTLEQRVAERTQELIASNSDLAASIGALKAAEGLRGEREQRLRNWQDLALKLSLDPRVFHGTLEQSAMLIAQGAASALQVARVSIWQANGTTMRALAIHDSESGPDVRMFDTGDFENYVEAPRTLRALSATDARNDPRTLAFTSGYLVPLGITSLLDAPIRDAGVLAGVVCLEARGTARNWDADEQGFVAVLGDLMSQVFLAAERRDALNLARAENQVLRVMSDSERTPEALRSIVEQLAQTLACCALLKRAPAGNDPEPIANEALPPALAHAFRELDESSWVQMCRESRVDLSAPSPIEWQRIAATEGFLEARAQVIGSPETPSAALLLLARNGFSDSITSLAMDRASRLLDLGMNALSQHAQIRASEQRWHLLYDDNPSMYLTLDARAQILSVNAFGAQRLGYSAAELNGSGFEVLADQIDIDEFRSALAKLSLAPAALSMREASLRMATGERMWARLTLRARTMDSASAEYLLTCEDLTENRALAQRLHHQAEHDQLSGLKNRRAIEQVIRQMLEQVERGEPSGALIYLDLDQFKVINDTLGHSAGDELLRQITRVFKQCMPLNAVLGRIGGDEFAAVLSNLTIERANALAEDLRAQMERFRFRMNSHAMQITASLSVVPIDAHARDVAHILSAADTACYAAKETGRNRVVLARHDDSEVQRRRSEMQWISKLNRAFDENLFELYYQPIENLASSEPLIQYELLLRMRSDTATPHAPEQFLRAAERFGMGPRIDRHVLTLCFQELARHPKHLELLTMCSINLSGQSLGFPKFFDELLGLLTRFQIPPEKICFEVTETAAIANLAVAEASIGKLAAIGFQFALDDFGSGFSSFAYLKSLPVDTLKIDGNFVRNMLTDPLDYAVVKSIQEVARAMGKRTTAEYVESAEIRAALLALGVDAAQGYYIGRPSPWRDLLASSG